MLPTDPAQAPSGDDPERILGGGGEMGALMRSIDWSRTPLGPVGTWPLSLRAVLGLLLGSEVPVFVLWGPELVQFYNDGARPVLGAKHPAAMGQRARDCWSEIWDVIWPMYASVLAGGATSIRDGLLILDRKGFLEECYFDYAYSPLRDDSGAVRGIYAAVAETTERVTGNRRLALMQQLSLQTSVDPTVEAVFRSIEAVLGGAALDLPFGLLYALAGDQATLVPCVGLERASAAAPEALSLGAEAPWPVGDVARSGEEALVEDLPERFGALIGKAWPEPVTRALVLPLAAGTAHALVFVAGVSPRLGLDDAYRGFLQLLARQLAASIASTRALEEEKHRAAQLAELDHQKTTFFSNVSHEFRTPLTLILGPTEDAMASPARVLAGEQLERVHGNAQRLLKLVNSLLEFARVEAGKSKATFEPVALAALTAGLAQAFESVVQQAGLRLLVDCPPLPEPVWVDPELWEKVVLNLVSNALKFTLAGQLTVRQRWTGEGVELTVADTGVGIAAEELPRIFQRFHRVEGAEGRSHEGSGIGLSLVQELVRLHGGRVEVASTVGEGSTFTVALPAGHAHLPPESVRATTFPAAPSEATAAFVREAAHWVPAQQTPPLEQASDPRPHVLLADDNADMRAYLQQVLQAHFTVDAVRDGQEALIAAQERLPDVVLSDVMMPRMDGMALIRALRAEPRTAHVPIVLLSARAGELSTVEGLDAGADDYLVKPFGARELVARLQGAVKVARTDLGRRRALERIAEVMDVMGDGFFSMDALWRITAVNPSYERLSHTRREDVLGRVFWEIFPTTAEPQSQFWQQYHRCMQEQVPVHFVEHYAPLSLWTDVRAHPTPDGGIAVFFRDISAEREAEVVRQRQAEFEQQLIGIVSHDLRNPLHAIHMGADLLARREDLSDGLVKTVVRIENSANRAIRLVNDLLDFTKARLGGGIPVHPVPTDIHALVHAVLVEVEATHPERQVDFSQWGDGNGSWDPDRVGQAVQNLVTNALKYSPAGTPVTVASRGEADRVVLSIHNGGAPIPASLLVDLFEPFRRGAAAESTGRSVGLGLYIVKKVVDAHRGSIDAASTEAGGTTFTLSLPRASA